MHSLIYPVSFITETIQKRSSLFLNNSYPHSATHFEILYKPLTLPPFKKAPVRENRAFLCGISSIFQHLQI